VSAEGGDTSAVRSSNFVRSAAFSSLRPSSCDEKTVTCSSNTGRGGGREEIDHSINHLVIDRVSLRGGDFAKSPAAPSGQLAVRHARGARRAPRGPVPPIPRAQGPAARRGGEALDVLFCSVETRQGGFSTCSIAPCARRSSYWVGRQYSMETRKVQQGGFNTCLILLYVRGISWRVGRFGERYRTAGR